MGRLIAALVAFSFSIYQLPLVNALLQQPFISFDNCKDAIALRGAPILLSSDESSGVHIATKNLVHDLDAIMGVKPALINTTAIVPESFLRQDIAIIIGSLEHSSFIRTIQDQTGLDTAKIEGKWESFMTIVLRNPLPGIQQALLIIGSDMRGTIYGIYSLSEQSGQSPYHWWADVPTKKHDNIFALPGCTYHGEPSVKYRGLFINDEAPVLESWWSEKHGEVKKPFNVDFYRHIYELILRLKGNFMWPAMWASIPKPGNTFFTDDPGNQQLAADYGIVLSTSHHEPMQRATNEWLFSGRGDWNWVTNKDNISNFMEEGARRAKSKETVFTVGMRGDSDEMIRGEDPVATLKDVFATQRKIFEKVYGDEIAVGQAWTIYKEVSELYAAGAIPPEDVTLVYTDDNFGNIQRLPTPSERTRPGGFGVYFHLEYVGVPRAYKWTNTNALSKVLKDLFHIYESGADRLWVVNVGDVKPMELPFGFIMDYAWNTSSIDFHSIPDYLKLYSAREFGVQYAESIADILLELNRLLAIRRHEGVTPSTFSLINYNESAIILAQWGALARRSRNLFASLPPTYRTSFFELVHYPCVSGHIFYQTTLLLGKNQLYGEERRNSANSVAEAVLQSFNEDYRLTQEFDKVCNGKWKNIMSQTRYGFNETWVPPSRDTISGLSFVQLEQNTVPALGNLGVSVDGMNTTLTGRWCEVCQNSKPLVDPLYQKILPFMTPYGPSSTYIELFMRGDHRIPMHWTVAANDPFVKLHPQSGILDKNQPDAMVTVKIDWAQVADDLVDTKVFIESSQGDYEVVILRLQNFAIPSKFKGFPVAGGIVSMEGPHFQSQSSDKIRFSHVPFLGTRSQSGSLALRPFREAQARPIECAEAYVDYNFYLASATKKLEAILYFNMVLDTDPEKRLKYSLTLDRDSTADDFRRLVNEPPNPGSLPGGWQDAVLDGVWKTRVVFYNVSGRSHFVRFKANSPEIYLEKIVLDTGDHVRPSYLGPPETQLSGASPILCDQSSLLSGTNFMAPLAWLLST